MLALRRLLFSSLVNFLSSGDILLTEFLLLDHLKAEFPTKKLRTSMVLYLFLDG